MIQNLNSPNKHKLIAIRLLINIIAGGIIAIIVAAGPDRLAQCSYS
jgi:hypothetical protein